MLLKMLPAAHVRCLFCSLLLPLAKFAAGSDSQALAADDECGATGIGGCAVEALQRRGAKLAGNASSGECYGGSAAQYNLNWQAKGATFFDDWTFVTKDMTNGAVNYLDRKEALAKGVVQAFDDHAIMRVGGVKDGKRDSVNIHTNSAWDPHKSFLVAMKYRHVPYGAGVWPAFWMTSTDFIWPTGGELDVLEFANDEPSVATFHTKGSCSMDAGLLQRCTPPYYYLIDKVEYKCDTDYAKNKIGCKPPQKRVNGNWFNQNPGTIVAEWNEHSIKLWHFKNGQEPADLKSDQPRPATWDVNALMAWMPFVPSTCKGDAFAPQEIIFNIELCGDYAGGTWDKSPLSYLTGYGAVFRNCKGAECCGRWVEDSRSSSSMEQYAFFDVDYVKVFTLEGKTTPHIVSKTYERGGMPVDPAAAKHSAGRILDAPPTSNATAPEAREASDGEASDGEAIVGEASESQCVSQSDVSCTVWSCKASMGPTDCVAKSGSWIHKRCRCKAGYCLKAGRCVQGGR